MTAVDDLADDIRTVDGKHDLSATDLAEALLKRGWTRTAAPAENLPLTSYNEGDFVSVLNQENAWVDGRVVAREEISNYLQIDTESGPVTIATNRRVRLQ